MGRYFPASILGLFSHNDMKENKALFYSRSLHLGEKGALRFIYIRAKVNAKETSLQMGSQRIILSVYIRGRQRSKKKLFSLSLSL